MNRSNALNESRPRWTAQLTWYYCLNPNAVSAYVQVFDSAATVTLGTTVPRLSLGREIVASNIQRL